MLRCLRPPREFPSCYRLNSPELEATLPVEALVGRDDQPEVEQVVRVWITSNKSQVGHLQRFTSKYFPDPIVKLASNCVFTWEFGPARFGKLQLVDVFGDPELRRRSAFSRPGFCRRLFRVLGLQREQVQHCGISGRENWQLVFPSRQTFRGRNLN